MMMACRQKMKIKFIFLIFLMLIVSIGAAQEPRRSNEACGFTVQGQPAQPEISGPENIVPLVYVVEQPDSPIEVVSVDLNGMSLSVANEQHIERDCAKLRIRNRSDRPVRGFEIGLNIASAGGAAGFGAISSSPLASGETVEVASCGGGGRGGAPGNYVRLLVAARSVDFGECLYQPSQRIPRSLKLHPVS